MGEAADTKAEKYGGSNASKMPEADKIRLTNLNKQADDISQAIIKARADGSWDEASPNAKALTSQLTGLRMQSNDLSARYSAGAGAGDPPGLRGSAPSNSGTAAPRPSKFASTPAEKDRATILQTELAQRLQDRDAAQPNSAEWTRANADVQSLAGELKGIGINANVGQVPAAAPQRRLTLMGGGAVGAPAPTPAPAPFKPQQTGDQILNNMQAQHMAVLGGLSANVKTAQSQLAAAAKSGDPKAVSAYAAALQQARDKLQSEAEKRLGNNAPAYLSSVN
jgi:hypothetical protein